MTTAGRSHRRWDHRVAKYATPILVAYATWALVAALFYDPAVAVAVGQSRLALVVSWATSMLAMVVSFFVWVRGIFHGSRRLCEWCFAEAPVDSSQQAARHHRAFGFIHWCVGRWWFLPAVAAGLTVPLLFVGVRLGNLIWVALWAVLIAFMRCGRLHSRYQPWCPWCRRGGGEDEDAPAPTTAPVGEA